MSEAGEHGAASTQPEGHDHCLCGEELDENGECPDCDCTDDCTNPADDLWWEEED